VCQRRGGLAGLAGFGRKVLIQKGKQETASSRKPLPRMPGNDNFGRVEEKVSDPGGSGTTASVKTRNRSQAG